MKKNRLIVYLGIITIMMGSLLLMGASCSASTANVSNGVMTSGVDENIQPIDSLTEFPVNTDVYVTAELHNAPDDTDITFVWYLDNQVIETVTITNEDVTDAPLWGVLPAELVTQPGNYAVGIYIDDREEADTLNEFVVK